MPYEPFLLGVGVVFTVIFDIIAFLIPKHFKTVTVTVILRKLIQMAFLDGNWESMEMKGRLRGQDGNGNGNSSEFQDGNGNGNFRKINSQEYPKHLLRLFLASKVIFIF